MRLTRYGYSLPRRDISSLQPHVDAGHPGCPGDLAAADRARRPHGVGDDQRSSAFVTQLDDSSRPVRWIEAATAGYGAGQFPSEARRWRLRIRRRRAWWFGWRHDGVRAERDVRRRTRQTGLREADADRAVQDGVARHGVRVHRRARRAQVPASDVV